MPDLEDSEVWMILQALRTYESVYIMNRETKETIASVRNKLALPEEN